MPIDSLPSAAATAFAPPLAPQRVAQINGVPLHLPGESLQPEALRQRACTELLRQAAQAEGLLDAADAASSDGVISAAATTAIDALLESQLALPEPSEAACRRHFDANARSWRTGEKVHMRHILFALMPGMDVVALRNRAETCLLDVRCHDGKVSGKVSEKVSGRAADDFARSAREFSNCPSGAEGGDLGWLSSGDIAPELARELFGQPQIGVLPRLVHSRFGLHVVEVIARKAGIDHTFEEVRGAAAMSLRRQTFVTALRQYLRLLAGQANVIGVDLDAAETPLVQ